MRLRILIENQMETFFAAEITKQKLGQNCFKFNFQKKIHEIFK